MSDNNLDNPYWYMGMSFANKIVEYFNNNRGYRNIAIVINEEVGYIEIVDAIYRDIVITTIIEKSRGLYGKVFKLRYPTYKQLLEAVESIMISGSYLSSIAYRDGK